MNNLKIQTIEISKFRSLKKIKCDLSDISVFVGQNDAGKSNILKALNLFFNNEVEPSRNLVFNEDFNYGGHINKKADEIAIKLTFTLPDNYHSKNGKYLVWEKRWRQDGEYRFEKEADYFYGLDNQGNKINISPKANVRSLMNRINFIYVPAIRDMGYFDNLRLRIYNTMTKVAENSLTQASNTFENNISKALQDLVDATKKSLGENIVMSFPKNLANIFEKLDFLSGENKVSLNKRGDGIKNRYIPLILNFIATNEKEITGKGAAPYTFIWGYEEPENNMEIRNCMELSEEFSKYVQDAVSQIILTTHSPVFYNIKNKLGANYSVKVCHVMKTIDGTYLKQDCNNLDSDMGTAAMMSKAYQQLEERLNIAKARQQEVELLLETNHKPCLFVEGSTDKIILEKLLKVYNLAHDFIIKDGRLGGGESYVIDMLKAWELTEKHQNPSYRAAGLVDEDAVKSSKDYNCQKNQKNITKCFVLPSSSRIIEWKAKEKYNISSYLETFYPDEIWQKAKDKGWLISKDYSDILNDSTQKKCINGEENKENLLSDLPLCISHKIDQHKKGNLARFVCKLQDKDLEECFGALKSKLEEIINYLNGVEND